MAGEESGDIHASKLVHHIKKYNPNTRKHEFFIEKKLPPHSK